MENGERKESLKYEKVALFFAPDCRTIFKTWAPTYILTCEIWMYNAGFLEFTTKNRSYDDEIFR